MFFTFLIHNNVGSENGHRTVRERSEYSLTVLSTGSGREISKEDINQKIIALAGDYGLIEDNCKTKKQKIKR